MAKSAILVERAKAMRREPTPFERTLWLSLKAGRLAGAKFRRQQVIGSYIVDFACRLPTKLVIEVDGYSHESQIEYDQRRSQFFEAQGYQVIRFGNHDIANNLEGVLMTIATSLGLPLSPALSPEGEREVLQ